MENINDFSKGSVAKNIMNLAVPMTVAQLVNVLYNVVDRIYIGHIPHASTEALTVSPAPLAMEHSGAPPIPNRLANAVIIVITGSASPIPVSASVEAWGMLLQCFWFPVVS